MMYQRIGSTVMLTALTSCSGFLGSTNTLDVLGPHSLKGKSYVYDKPSQSLASVADFEISFHKADEDQQKVSNGETPSDVEKHARQMAVDGIKLTDVYCQEFFASGGANQKWINVAKDIVTLTGTAATSVLALSSPANATAAGAVGLFTATANGGVDVYTRNFLFGVDNIDTVRKLTMKAMQAQADEALKKDDAAPSWDFHVATGVVRDHQYLCSPAAIRTLVIGAIKTADVGAAPATSDTFKDKTPPAAPKSKANMVADAAHAAKIGAPKATNVQVNSIAEKGMQGGETVAKRLLSQGDDLTSADSASQIESGTDAAALSEGKHVGLSSASATVAAKTVTTVIVPNIIANFAPPPAGASFTRPNSASSRSVDITINNQKVGP